MSSEEDLPIPSRDGKPDAPTWRKPVAASAFAAALASGGALLLKLLESGYELIGLSAFVAILVFNITIPRTPEAAGGRSEEPGDFEAQRDSDISERGDARVYREYRKLLAEVYWLWASGTFQDAAELQRAKDRVLDGILFAEAFRLHNVCKRLVTLAVIQDTGINFVARRSSKSPIGTRIERGMTCPHTSSLDDVLEKYAKFFYKAEFQVCGQTYYLVGLSDDQPFTATSISVIEDAATQYQANYQFFRMAAVTRLPTHQLPSAGEEA
jgi:hypothetical protein